MIKFEASLSKALNSAVTILCFQPTIDFRSIFPPKSVDRFDLDFDFDKQIYMRKTQHSRELRTHQVHCFTDHSKLQFKN